MRKAQDLLEKFDNLRKFFWPITFVEGVINHFIDKI